MGENQQNQNSNPLTPATFALWDKAKEYTDGSKAHLWLLLDLNGMQPLLRYRIQTVAGIESVEVSGLENGIVWRVFQELERRVGIRGHEVSRWR